VRVDGASALHHSRPRGILSRHIGHDHVPIVQLPNAHLAIIDDSKVRDYLLSATHPVGRAKARFFRGLGFSAGHWPWLAHALRQHAETGDASPVGMTPYGRKFAVRAMLRGPSGRSALVVSIWLLARDVARPRLITAYPLQEDS
jgi:hypothetical protein